MKRYRGKDANYHRLATAFVPARKWGKRNKREFLKQIDDPRQHEPLLREMFGAWIWTAPNHTQYTTITGPDGAEYIVTVEAAIHLAKTPTEPPSLMFDIPKP